jgi:hypothetical protein
MERLYALFLLALALPAISSANGEDPRPRPSANRHSSWKRSKDLVNGRISRSKLVTMQDVTDNMIIYLQDSCSTEETNSTIWHAEFISDGSSMMRFGVQCNFAEKASLKIMANEIAPLLNHLVVNGTDYLTLKPLTGVRNESPYFEYSADEEANDTPAGVNSLQTKTWLIASDGKNLPYTTVSRREYLKEAMAELEQIRAGIVAKVKAVTPVRPVAVQESEKKAILDQFNSTYSGIELQVRVKGFLQRYRTDDVYLEEKIKLAAAEVDETLHLMQDLLSHLSAPALGKPAIVSVQATDFQGFEDGHADSKMLIRFNKAYFDGGLGGEKPQFFLVRWTYDPSNQLAANLDQLISQKFDGRALKDLLKK